MIAPINNKSTVFPLHGDLLPDVLVHHPPLLVVQGQVQPVHQPAHAAVDHRQAQQGLQT